MNDEMKQRIGRIVANLVVTRLFGDEQEQASAKAVMAGMVVTLNEILPPDPFRALMAEWDINPIDLAELFEVAGFDTNDPVVQKSIEI